MAVSRGTLRMFVLAALTVVAAVVLAVSIWPGRTADTQGSGQTQVPAGGVAAQDPAVPQPLAFDRMQAERAAPANRRDLFRFGAAAPDPVSETGGQPGQPGQAGQSGRGRRGTAAPEPVEQPQMPPAPPPIPLRFVGLLEDRAGRRIAALSDGRYTYNAREGDVIEGRWRVVKIGEESLVIERIDGTGRQTIRKAG